MWGVWRICEVCEGEEDVKEVQGVWRRCRVWAGVLWYVLEFWGVWRM